MDTLAQSWRKQADTADLRELWQLLRAGAPAELASGTMHVKSLLARVAFCGMLEQGASYEEIANAIGTTPQRIASLKLPELAR